MLRNNPGIKCTRGLMSAHSVSALGFGAAASHSFTRVHTIEYSQCCHNCSVIKTCSTAPSGTPAFRTAQGAWDGEMQHWVKASDALATTPLAISPLLSGRFPPLGGGGDSTTNLYHSITV